VIEQLQQELDRRDAVSDGVVDLEHESHPPLGQAFDHPELPQRTRSVERLRGDLGHQTGEDLLRPRSGRPHPIDVAPNAEVGIIDPDRMVEAERNGGQAASEGNQIGYSFLHQA
jgi:hypothetical protein